MVSTVSTKTAGIYKISCSANSKFYIGSSINIETRFKQHKSKLKKNCHSNKHLQSAWNKYGEVSFTFEILEIIQENNIEIVRNLEQKMLDSYLSEDWGKLFNIAITVDMTITSDETKANMLKDWENPERKQKMANRVRKSGSGIYPWKNNKYKAQISSGGTTTYLGVFDTYEQALFSRLKAEEYYWGKEYKEMRDDPNYKKKKLKKSGAGIRLEKSGRYSAYIDIKEKQKRLGTFTTKEEALAARLEAEKLYWGESDAN